MVLRIARWWLTLLAGLLIGCGLFLHGQVAVAHEIRNEVAGTFFLWRAVGNVTFFLQGADHRIALTLAEVPESVLRESDRAAWTLLIVGGLLAFASPLLRRPQKGKPTKARAR
jgi:hypothetical protein